MSIRRIDYIVIHCTATSQKATIESIQRYWRENLGWKSPGYHILISPDGTRSYLQPLGKLSNGVKGFNQVSIHISYIGGVDSNNKPLDNRTEPQKAGILNSIYEAIHYAKQIGVNPIIQGHSDFPNVAKACPCFDAKKEYEWITI